MFLESVIDMIKSQLINLKKIYNDHLGNLPEGQPHIMMSGIEDAETELSWMHKVFSDAVEGRL